jgi:hypothetical protein
LNRGEVLAERISSTLVSEFLIKEVALGGITVIRERDEFVEVLICLIPKTHAVVRVCVEFVILTVPGDKIFGLRLVDDKVKLKPLILDSVQASRRLLRGFDATLRRFTNSFEIVWIRCEPLSPYDKMVDPDRIIW